MENEIITKKRRPYNEDNMIPLINIVFLLLIFYMVAGQIKSFQADGIDLPISTQATTTKVEPLQIQINNKNELYFNGSKITLQQLDKKLKNSSSALNQGVSLQADKDITALKLNKILDILRQNKISSVKLYTKK